jgi:hypothetical protein
VIVSITVLACSSPDYNSASYVDCDILQLEVITDILSFVFGNFVNSTGCKYPVSTLALGILC